MKLNAASHNELRAKWDDFCRTSSEAWFWSTTSWADYQEAHGSKQFDGIAALEDNGRILGVLPGWGRPPALADGLNHGSRARVLDFLLDRAPGTTTMQSTPLAPTDDGLALHDSLTVCPGYSQLLKVGSMAEVWRGVRHGHRSNIRAGERTIPTVLLDESGFDAYVALHQKASGRKTRPDRTFELMREWIGPDGSGFVVGARLGDRVVGAAYVFLYKDGACYGSAANDPDYPDLPIGHVVQWSIIRRLSETQIALYELGHQPLPGEGTEKEQAIARFKRGFGGKTVYAPVYRKTGPAEPK